MRVSLHVAALRPSKTKLLGRLNFHATGLPQTPMAQGFDDALGFCDSHLASLKPAVCRPSVAPAAPNRSGVHDGGD
jgi:hypothetical protein